MNRCSLLVRTSLVTLAVCSGTAAASINVQTIALSATNGPFGPGLGPGVTFSTLDIHSPVVNSSGHVVFRGVIGQAGSRQGAWLHGGATNSNIALAGDAIPGGGLYPSGAAGIVAGMQINASGDWALRVGASTGAVSSLGGVPLRGPFAGDAAPGTGGANFATVASNTPLFNDAGQIGFVGGLAQNPASDPPTIGSAPNANNNGVWIGQPGGLTLVVRQNDWVTSIDPLGGVRVGTFTSNSMALNHLGRFAMAMNLQGSVTAGTGAGSNSVMIASNRGGALEVIARTGDTAPDASGAPSADFYRAFSATSVGFNNAGRVVFQGSTRDSDGNQTSASSLFTDAGSGVLRQVGRAGASLPTISRAATGEFDGLTWATFGGSPMINGSDALAFAASVGGAPTGTGNVLLTMGPADLFTKVARSGDVAIVDAHRWW